MTDTCVPAPDWVRRQSVEPSYIVLSFLHRWMSERALSGR